MGGGGGGSTCGRGTSTDVSLPSSRHRATQAELGPISARRTTPSPNTSERRVSRQLRDKPTWCREPCPVRCVREVYALWTRAERLAVLPLGPTTDQDTRSREGGGGTPLSRPGHVTTTTALRPAPSRPPPVQTEPGQGRPTVGRYTCRVCQGARFHSPPDVPGRCPQAR